MFYQWISVILCGRRAEDYDISLHLNEKTDVL